jgi:hypothetical protein
MRHRFIVTTAMLVLVASLPARQSRGQQPQKLTAAKTAAPAPAKAQSIEIYRIARAHRNDAR